MTSPIKVHKSRQERLEVKSRVTLGQNQKSSKSSKKQIRRSTEAQKAEQAKSDAESEKSRLKRRHTVNVEDRKRQEHHHHKDEFEA
jgi:hypothetical protein